MLGANNISNLDLKTKNLKTFLYNYYKEVSDICDEINTIWIIHMGRYMKYSVNWFIHWFIDSLKKIWLQILFDKRYLINGIW